MNKDTSHYINLSKLNGLTSPPWKGGNRNLRSNEHVQGGF